MNRHAKPWVESMLVAYVDHQLDPAQTAAVDDIVREDAEARTIVSVLRGTGEAVREAFEQPLHEAVPARLLAALGATGAGNIVPMRRPARSVPMRQLLTALAASIAILFVGVGVGYVAFAPAGRMVPAETESSKFEATLYGALEREAAGATLRYDDPATATTGSVTVAGRIASSLGNDCREFQHEWTGAQGKGSETGLACRTANGEWSMLTVPHGPAS